MIIMSDYFQDKKFVEVRNLKDCESVESDCFAFISFDAKNKEDSQYYFKLGSMLRDNEVPYAVLLSHYVGYGVNFTKVIQAKCHEENIELGVEMDWKDKSFIRSVLFSDEEAATYKKRKQAEEFFQRDIMMHDYEQTRAIVSAEAVKHTIANNNEASFIPLGATIFTFAKLGASFCIFDERNYSMLPFAQTLANYYLLDMKILALVENFADLDKVFYWICGDTERIDYGLWQEKYQHIGIDGVVEKSLLQWKKK